jgi:hypothetical protein
MQNDSAPAAVNFINLLFIGISLDIGVPWRDSGPLQFILAMMGASAPQCVAKVGFNAPTLGPGKAPAACHSRGAKRDTLSLPRPTSEDHQHPHS